MKTKSSLSPARKKAVVQKQIDVLIGDAKKARNHQERLLGDLFINIETALLCVTNKNVRQGALANLETLAGFAQAYKLIRKAREKAETKLEKLS